MAHDNDTLAPAEMQSLKHVRIRLVVTASMLRGLLAWLDRKGYVFSAEYENE